jgi:hypothetical protein
MPTPKIRYGRYHGCAVRYTDDEAWMLVDGAWREHEPVFVRIKADRLTRRAYLETFGRVPPLPRAAFDPCRDRPPSYGCDDGYAVRFRDHEAWACYADGKWPKISPTEAAFKAALLTEQGYLRMFGPTSRRPVPPLPPEAFRSGWRSPLV